MASEARTLTVRLGIEFDGTEFHGWQVQPRDRTVQGEIEQAIWRVTGARVRIAGAGRTDSGCHAAGQVASATLSTRLTPDRLRAALNAHLPPDVRIIEAAEAEPRFHARFGAMRRAYRYLVAPQPSALKRRYAWIRPIRADLEALKAVVGSEALPRIKAAVQRLEGSAYRIADALYSSADAGEKKTAAKS